MTTNQTEQYVLNYSFDELYKILMAGLAAYNATSGTYDRVQVDNTTGGLKTIGSGGTLVPEKYDSITASYPSSSTEQYVYKLASTTVATVTVTYSDSTKTQLTSVVRT
jgi:hypothetical protein